MCAYKPPVVKGAGFGPRGKAKVQVKGDRVRVLLHEVTKDNEEIEHEAILNKEDCPEQVKPGMWYVSLSSDKKKMYNLHPINGMFTVHVLKFTAKKDEQPAPRVHTGSQYGDWYSFTPILEFLDEDVKGMTVGYDLPYNFTPVEEEVKGEKNKVVGISHPKSKYTEKLTDFLEVTGVWEAGPMKWLDNLCPKLEQRMLRKDAHFKIIMKNGFVDTIYGEDALPESEDVPEKEDDDNIPF